MAEHTFDTVAIFLAPVRHHVRDMAAAHDVLMAWPEQHRDENWRMCIRAYKATVDGRFKTPHILRETLIAAARVAGILHQEHTVERQRARAASFNVVRHKRTLTTA